MMSSLGRPSVERALWLCGSAEILTSQFFRFLIPVFATTLLAATSQEVGALVSAFNMPVLVAAALIGPAVSRHSSAAVVRTCSGVAAGLLLLACGAQMAGALTQAWLLVLCLFLGLCFLAFEVAFTVLVPQVVAASRLVLINGRFELSQALVHLLAPASIAVFASARWSGYALAMLAALMAMAAVCCPPPATVRPVSSPNATFLDQLNRGFGVLLRDPRVRSLTLRLFAWNAVDAAFVTLLIPYWIVDVKAPSAAMAMSFALNGAGVVMGAWLTPRVLSRVSIGSAMLASVLLASACALVLVLVPPETGARGLVSYPACLLLGNAVAVYRIAHTSIRQQIVPPQVLAEVTGSMRFVTSLAVPLAPWVAGICGTAFGNQTTLLAFAAAGFGMALLAIFFSPMRGFRPAVNANQPA